jgi:hypothetical protein
MNAINTMNTNQSPVQVIRVYARTKSQMAALYFPNIQLLSARKKLVRWMHRSTELMAALESTGYHANQRNLSCKQVGLIFRYLGEPGE